MPPRYAYWTILIDQKPTAFRAREREELLPTFHQLSRKSNDVVLKWFARGRLWESPEQAQAAQHAAKPPIEKRGHAWRPGGDHRDPRERFKKRSQPPRGASSEPFRDRDKPRDARPWSKPADGAPRSDRPWTGKPKGFPPRSDRPWSSKPKDGPPRGDRPWSNKPKDGPPRGDRPWSDKPKGPPRGDRPWSSKPGGGPPRENRPWGGKPPGERPRGAGTKPSWPGPSRGDKSFAPRKPFAPRGGEGTRKPWQRDRPTEPRRDDDAPKRSAETPASPPPSERIRTRPKPPEKG